jgi:glycosyltransferase involved in cell wall biosynthesis
MLARLVATQVLIEPRIGVLVVSLTTVGAIGEEMRRSGMDIVDLGVRSLLHAPAAVFRLWRLTRQFRPDVVQTWMPHSDLLGGIAARLAGIKTIIWGVRRTDYSLTPPATRLVRWVGARLSHAIPCAIVCAAESARRAQVAAGYDAGRMVVIPNGFDVDLLKPDAAARAHMHREFRIAPNALVVGSVGRYDPAKDHANFIAAAARAAVVHKDLFFLMVGRDVDEDNQELMSLIGATGMRHRFLLLGERADVGDCMNAMDIFVLSSRTEAFPNVVGEAMAVGLPCVVTDVGDAATIVGDAGVVTRPADSQALADAIVQLASLPPAERIALGQRARARISTEYSLQASASRFAALYERVVTDLRSVQRDPN